MTFFLFNAIFANDKNSVVDRESELVDLKQRINKFKKTIDLRSSERDQLFLELNQVENLIVIQKRELKNLEKQLQTHQLNKKELDIKSDKLAVDLEAHALILRQYVRDAYSNRKQSKLKLLLEQDDPLLIARLLSYYRYLSAYRIESIQEIQLDIEEVSELQAQGLISQQKIIETLNKRQNKLDDLSQTQEKRRKLLLEKDRQLSELGAQIIALEQEQKDLLELIKSISSVISNDSGGVFGGFDKLRGNLSWPVLGVVSKEFGSQRAGKSVKWNGIVINAKRGLNIKSVHDGRIIFADWLVGMGLLLIIDHGDNYMTLYGYNETILKSVGEIVKSGETVATIGDSGGQSDTGLYFEIRHETKPENPLLWFGVN